MSDANTKFISTLSTFAQVGLMIWAAIATGGLLSVLLWVFVSFVVLGLAVSVSNV